MGPHFIGFAPGRRSDVGRRTKAMSGEVFFGRTEGRTADGGEKEM